MQILGVRMLRLGPALTGRLLVAPLLSCSLLVQPVGPLRAAWLFFLLPLLCFARILVYEVVLPSPSLLVLLRVSAGLLSK